MTLLSFFFTVPLLFTVLAIAKSDGQFWNKCPYKVSTTHPVQICGSDGITYPSICKFSIAQSFDTSIRFEHVGPCSQDEYVEVKWKKTKKPKSPKKKKKKRKKKKIIFDEYNPDGNEDNDELPNNSENTNSNWTVQPYQPKKYKKPRNKLNKNRYNPVEYNYDRPYMSPLDDDELNEKNNQPYKDPNYDQWQENEKPTKECLSESGECKKKRGSNINNDAKNENNINVGNSDDTDINIDNQVNNENIIEIGDGKVIANLNNKAKNSNVIKFGKRTAILYLV